MMSLAAEYRQQFRSRPWKLVLEEVPLRLGHRVLDLDCGIGDQAKELAARGCKVIGVDASQELIDETISQNLPNCEFRNYDLRNLPELDIKVGGIWCSFATAYFTDLPEFLRHWAQYLEAKGWMAVTEIEHKRGHYHCGSTRTDRFVGMKGFKASWWATGTPQAPPVGDDYGALAPCQCRLAVPD
jgi:trans-aconitate methyltransferase